MLETTQAEKYAEEDKAWELKLSKKYNDLAGVRSHGWRLEDAPQSSPAWEAAYNDQHVDHAFTGILQRFDKPLGDTSHAILSIWNGHVRIMTVWPYLKSALYKLQVACCNLAVQHA